MSARGSSPEPHDPVVGLWNLSFSAKNSAHKLITPVTAANQMFYEAVRDAYLNDFWGDADSDTAIANAVSAEFNFFVSGWVWADKYTSPKKKKKKK